jgi:hypothetical protein
MGKDNLPSCTYPYTVYAGGLSLASLAPTHAPARTVFPDPFLHTPLLVRFSGVVTYTHTCRNQQFGPARPTAPALRAGGGLGRHGRRTGFRLMGTCPPGPCFAC